MKVDGNTNDDMRHGDCIKTKSYVSFEFFTDNIANKNAQNGSSI